MRAHTTVFNQKERDFMDSFTTQSSTNQQIEPDEQGGRTQTVTIGRQNITPRAPAKGRKKAKTPKRRILLGFDTEYQTHQPVTTDELEAAAEAGGIKNQLLSYQFCIRIVSDDRNNGPETEGIIIPPAQRRLAIREFIGFALGALVDRHPDIELPDSIYLIGHFTRADIPGFSDFAETTKMVLSNIRSTFSSVDYSMPMSLCDDEGSFGEFKVMIRDTILMVPAGAKSLASVGEIVGFDKIKLADTPEKELDIKESMLRYRTTNWPQFREYAIRDAIICVRYAERILFQYFGLFRKFELPITLTSFGTQLVIDDWTAKGWKANDVLGREDVVEKVYQRRLGHYRNKEKNPLREEPFYEEAFVTETYHGGRNEQFLFGVGQKGTWRDFDLRSAYATAMAQIGLPDWDRVERIEGYEGVNPLDLAYFSVDFEFPESVRFPTLPVRTGNGIIFPRKGRSLCVAPEMFLAIKLGAMIEHRRAILVRSDRTQSVFCDFIKQCIDNRNKFERKSFDDVFWKEIGNSTYGKTAQGLRHKRVYDLRDDQMTEIPVSPITQPYFAAFITSYTRAVLGEILNSFSSDVCVFSVTTDGFLTNATDEDIHKATSGELFATFSEARRSLDGSDRALEVKHTIRQPIGWRTRGSATLMPGNDRDAIVLQKGGIKTNQLFDAKQENDYTVRQFLNRQPDSVIEYKSNIGLREMVYNNADFVPRSVEKRLSMEFDWKRTPVNPRKVTFDFEGVTYSHLTFDTLPLEDVHQFDSTREAWERYDKNPHRNLKTVADLEKFKNYLATNIDADKEVTRYMRREQGGLSRLKRDLTRAFVKHQAGFDKIRTDRTITYKEFCAALNDCGIPCAVSDLDNAKRNEFKAHQTPKTSDVLTAICRLKDEFFQELEIDFILVEENPAKNSEIPLRTAA